MKNRRMSPYDTEALASKLGHNSRTEKVVRSKFELGLPLMVLYFVYKFQMIYLKRTCYWSETKCGTYRHM